MIVQIFDGVLKYTSLKVLALSKYIRMFKLILNTSHGFNGSKLTLLNSHDSPLCARTDGDGVYVPPPLR